MIAICGYMLFGWTALESFYMVVITVFGVGYGEETPLKETPEKLFTIFVILAETSATIIDLKKRSRYDLRHYFYVN
ncbi:potassium channel family protein [Picosynechococcus sp. PCC 7003]|uniref:potassium channel family protein n=1 Tax=Picosynechococcus sp. PCC 7003 TaxID=374981 RepID=UPI001E296C0E|nr:potassium channel family protein [Picosynechococcus sp. PCC 7003]